MTDEKEGKWWDPLLIFLKEVIAGTIILILIGIPAICISLIVHWLEKQGIDSNIVTGLTMIEYTLFFVDGALFVFYIIKSAIKAGKEL